jgi:hypothetical protein
MKRALSAAVALAAALAATFSPALAHAQPDYFQKSAKANKVRYKEDIPRTRGEVITVVSLFGAAGLAGALGTYFTLDSGDSADKVNATQPTGKAWTPQLMDHYDDARRSRTAAIVSFSLAGALVVGGIVALAVTNKGSRMVELEQKSAFAAPLPDGGLLVGRSWSF